jgi:transposase-like protein
MGPGVPPAICLASTRTDVTFLFLAAIGASLGRALLLTFYSFPAEHWRHLRTTNPIESGFATIRHRARQTKGCGSRLATLAMMFKLGRECEKGWRRLNGREQIHKLIEGVRFIDGLAEKAA